MPDESYLVEFAKRHNLSSPRLSHLADEPALLSEIKAAVELLFKVEVEAVRVVNIAGKQKRFGRTMGRRSDVRKAYVALKAGQEINFSEAA